MIQKKEVQIALVSAFSLIILVVIFPKGKKRSGIPPSPITAGTSSQKESVNTANALQGQYFRLEEQTSEMEIQRDPFNKVESLAASGPAKANFTLMGISWDEESPNAIINDQIVQIGTEINGYKIIGITPDVVTLSDGIRSIELRLSL